MAGDGILREVTEHGRELARQLLLQRRHRGRVVDQEEQVELVGEIATWPPVPPCPAAPVPPAPVPPARRRPRAADRPQRRRRPRAAAPVLRRDRPCCLRPRYFRRGRPPRPGFLLGRARPGGSPGVRDVRATRATHVRGHASASTCAPAGRGWAAAGATVGLAAPPCPPDARPRGPRCRRPSPRCHRTPPPSRTATRATPMTIVEYQPAAISLHVRPHSHRPCSVIDVAPWLTVATTFTVLRLGARFWVRAAPATDGRLCPVAPSHSPHASAVRLPWSAARGR